MYLDIANLRLSRYSGELMRYRRIQPDYVMNNTPPTVLHPPKAQQNIVVKEVVMKII